MTVVGERRSRLHDAPVLRADTRRRKGTQLAWYLNRARSMPAPELLHRVGEQLRRARGRRLLVPAFAAERRDTGLGAVITEQGADADVRAYWRQTAAELCAGRIEVFGQSVFVHPSGLPDWRRDPVTGVLWADAYCFDVSYRALPQMDVKFTWELNRLLYLIAPAASGDLAASEVCAAHVADWIRSNPPFQGVAWASGIELATRLVALLVIAELLGDNAPDLARTALAHVLWLRRFPSRHSSANNHRIAELVGLLAAASAYPTLVDAHEAKALWAELEREALLQIADDGVSLEQSSSYGLAVLEWFLVGTVLGRRLGFDWSSAARERLSALATWITAMVDSAGHLVRVADDDEGRLLAGALPFHDSPRATIALARRLGLEVGPPKEGLTTFARGGYSVARDQVSGREVLWVLDHGPLGLGHIAAHGHADTLAVYLHLNGEPVIVDAGTYLYHGAGAWRDALRSTRLHNTLTVADLDSSLATGAFNWHPRLRATGRVVASEEGDAWSLLAEHDGYVSRIGVVHRRKIMRLSHRSYRIVDTIDGPGQVVQSSLLLRPQIDVETTDHGWSLSRDGERIAEVTVSDQFARRTARAEPDPPLGWYSPRFGVMEPSSQLLIRGWLDDSQELRVDIELPN